MPNEILPMKIWKLPKNKQYMRKEICNSGDYFGQIKKDGCFYQYEKDEEGNSYLFSRVISKKTGHLSEKSNRVPHIMNFLDARVPNGTIIIMELYYPSKTSNEVTEIMGCDPEKAIYRQEHEYGLLHAYMYDILEINGVNLVDDRWNLTRYLTLGSIVDRYGLYQPDFMELADIYYEDLDNRITQFIDSGEEGMVLKKKDGLYKPGKKPAWNMIKFKCEDNADVVCMGYKPPTKEYTNTGKKEVWEYWINPFTNEIYTDIDSEYYEMLDLGYEPITKNYAMGWIGSIKMGVYKDGQLIEVGTVSSGLTDELLVIIKEHKNSLIGQPMLVKYMQTLEEALRHPVFLKFRNDINAEDCTYDKIFD